MIGWYCPIPLLTCAIPNLKSIIFSLDFFIYILEINSDGRVCFILELVIDKTLKYGALSYIHIAEKTYFDIFINIVCIFFNYMLKDSIIDVWFSWKTTIEAWTILPKRHTLTTKRMATGEHNWFSLFSIC